MLWERLDDEPPAKKGAYPMKKYKATIRRPEAKDGDLADRCVAQYHALKDRPALDTAPDAPAAYESEAPF
jgi:hypothetical protein